MKPSFKVVFLEKKKVFAGLMNSARDPPKMLDAQDTIQTYTQLNIYSILTNFSVGVLNTNTIECNTILRFCEEIGQLKLLTQYTFG